MSFPVRAAFPDQVWDGSSQTRSTDLDGEPPALCNRPPDALDYGRAVAEVIACQGMVLDRLGPGADVLAADATSGFLWIPTIADIPSGNPDVRAGLVPIAYLPATRQLWIFRDAEGGWVASTAFQAPG